MFMQGGFTFCGTDIAKLGIYYAPEIENTYVYGNSELSVHDESFAGHHGGLHYGSTIQPKTFSLRCFFEEENINKGILDKVLNFFYKDRCGKLVFDDRDWLWYTATVVDVDTHNLTNYLNGFITINFKAYYPFARTDIYAKQISGSTTNYIDRDNNVIETDDEFIDNKALFLPYEQMPAVSYGSQAAPITQPINVLLYNAGNETASVAVSFQGTCGTDGVTLYNRTTGQDMRLVAFTRAATTNQNRTIVVDSLNGKTVLKGEDGSSSLMFIYHDYGFIEAAPSRHSYEGTNWSYTYGSNIVEADRPIYDDAVGQFIWIYGDWHEIVSIVDDHTVMVNVTNQPILETASGVSDVVLMNRIAVWVENGAQLDNITFKYNHTFR